MASHYYPLPSYNPGPGIDFSPLERALDGLQSSQTRNALMAREDKRLALDDQRWRTGDARAQQQLEMQKRRAQLEEDSLPLDRQTREAQLAQIKAQTAQLGQKNALETAIANMIGSSMGASDAPTPHPTLGSSNLGSNGVTPQSFDNGGGAPQFYNALSDFAVRGQPLPAGTNALMDARQRDEGRGYRPGIVLAADDMPYAGAPQRAPQQAPPQTSNSMAGLSPRQRQAFALGLAGKGDAGKILMDVENQNRLDKSAQTEVDKAELNATNGLARINEVSASFDPSYLTYQTQVGNWGRALLDKAGKLKPEDQSHLYKFATFRRDAARNINDAIKANSGATVTEQELARNLVELPNAGTGMFDGDSPTEFKAKLDRARETLTLGVARFRYLRQRGFTGAPWESGIDLDRMRGMINERAQQIVGVLKAQNPQASPAMLEQEADLRVKQEFGI